MNNDQIREAFEKWQGDPFAKHGIAKDAWFAAIVWYQQQGDELAKIAQRCLDDHPHTHGSADPILKALANHRGET